MKNQIIQGDCLEELKKLPKNSIDLIVTDPPFGIGFMGKAWDTFKPTAVKNATEKSSRKKSYLNPKRSKEARSGASPSFEASRYDRSKKASQLFQDFIYQASIECLRVLKPGAFMFMCMTPRQDSLSRAMIGIEEAGFNTGFTSMYWAYASGFPKASNIGKMVDKRNDKPRRSIELEKYLTKQIKKKYKSHHKLAKEMNVYESLIRHWIGKAGTQFLIPPKKQYDILKEKLGLDNRFDKLIEWEEAKREIIGKAKHKTLKEIPLPGADCSKENRILRDITIPQTKQAKKLEGSYGGFQPKPAVEVIIVAMKPRTEKTYVDQALKNGKGITWLDDCRIPTEEEITNHSRSAKSAISKGKYGNSKAQETHQTDGQKIGRFPANLLVSDDVLNDGKVKKTHGGGKQTQSQWVGGDMRKIGQYDSGSFSRYFDLDKWARFLIVPKASKSEKNKGLEGRIEKQVTDGRKKAPDIAFQRGETLRKNIHPTVKPIKLMAYLITLGSRQGDIVLDPFAGSFTTCIAAKLLKRKYIGIEKEAEYVKIGKARLDATPEPLL